MKNRALIGLCGVLSLLAAIVLISVLLSPRTVLGEYIVGGGLGIRREAEPGASAKQLDVNRLTKNVLERVRQQDARLAEINRPTGQLKFEVFDTQAGHPWLNYSFAGYGTEQFDASTWSFNHEVPQPSDIQSRNDVMRSAIVAELHSMGWSETIARAR